MEWKVIQCEETGERKIVYAETWKRYSKKEGQKIDGRGRVWVEVAEASTSVGAKAEMNKAPKVDKRAPVIPNDLVITPAQPQVPEPLTEGFNPAGATEVTAPLAAPVPVQQPVKERQKPGPKPKDKAQA